MEDGGFATASLLHPIREHCLLSAENNNINSTICTQTAGKI